MILALGLMVSTSAFAQQPTTVASSKAISAKDGSTVTYSVTGTGTFHWHLDDGSTTVGDLTSTTNSVDITWDDATPGDTYNLDVYLVDAEGCYSELYRYEITIQPVVLSIADAVTETCSFLASNGSSGNTDSGSDIIEFTVTADADGAQTPITVNYSITATNVDGSGTNVSETGSDEVELTANSGTLEVNINQYFVNTSGSDVVYTITITSATDVDGNSLTIATDNDEATISVHSVPTISFIN